MYKEMTDMTNEEMLAAIMGRMDSMEAGLNSRMDRLESRMDKLESRMDKLESRMDSLESRMDRLESRMNSLESRMDSLESKVDHLESRIENLETRFNNFESDVELEFKAVRTEMDMAYKVLKKDISILDDKANRLMYTKDVDGHEKMKIQVELLTKGYQDLKEKIG